MTVLAQLSNRTFTPNVNVLPFTVAANATLMQVTLTHANTLAAWPLGPLYKMDWDFGAGSTGTNSGDGAVFSDKVGVPIVGNILTTFATNKPPVVTSGTVTVTVLQPLTTAVLVESLP